jgi:competence protein ComEA
MPEPFAPSRDAASRPIDRSNGAETPDPQFWAPSRPSRPGRAGPARPYAAEGPLERALDRLRVWRTDPRAGVALLIAIAVIAGLAWYRIGVGSGGGDASAPAVEAAPAATGAAAPTTSSADGPVTVHVAGAVMHPGVIELPASSRVIDAVEAAGGGVPEADLDRMNLAAQLVDGQRILVQRVGEPAAPAAPGDTGGGTAPAPGAPTNEPINLNTATQEQLETLPGIGPSLAEAIIAERDRRGGFRSVNELRDVRGIGDKRFADLEGLVTV